MDDSISRQAAISIPILPKEHRKMFKSIDDAFETGWNEALSCVNMLPSAQPEPLTDKEQRIFLAAMGREEKVCKQVDEECRNSREPYEDSLVKTCHEITRKVKAALWTM